MTMNSRLLCGLYYESSFELLCRLFGGEVLSGRESRVYPWYVTIKPDKTNVSLKDTK